MAIIKSLFDTDLYKLTMQQAVLKLYPTAHVEYRFKNRGHHKFSPEFKKLFAKELQNLSELQASDDELEFLSGLGFIQPWYLDFMKSYRFDPSEVDFDIVDGELSLSIKGLWYKTILWEVPLMALISELYFSLEKDWSMDGQEDILNKKVGTLMSGGCMYADFGTRRRRCFEAQDMVVSKMKRHYWFAGTSNVHLAHKYDLKPIGTMAHEWVQGISALESMNHPNRFMMKKWLEVYGTDLGVALSDTYTTDSFLKDFNKMYACIFDGTRHDSGCPFAYTDKIVQHYKDIGIDYSNKSIVFSDALTAERAVEIQKYCNSKGIKCSFGIGTNFTNDFGTPALNMVIKLWSVDDIPVVKLSDNPGKANGEPKAVEFMRYLHESK